MKIEITDISNSVTAPLASTPNEVNCSNCHASCCHYEVMLISETGVPERHITENEYGVEVMLRLEDGWCSAMDRHTHMCTIYENRPWVCREFEMASQDCKSARHQYMNTKA
ncbi:hypothetical protein OA92_13025 [Marinomonas sp. SBI22]|uniref:YkgJ family cysteine cluster protein n=1 Tax=unclassified Marinomonas TaxID=196814 RepID=UPI0007AFB9A7|nr:MULTISPECIES: YkgJ family cysteine cluster protein [unclassified Marinomonas]KZM42127.1 hypothetical protein OA92_13025 [Marinomonas sp. SBI22]KZM47029.1 hypothetical protein OA91_00380 [Marinomonas sp. SBI8L]